MDHVHSRLMQATFAALCLLVAIYWLSVTTFGFLAGGGGFRILLIAMALASLAACVAAVVPRPGDCAGVFTIGMAALAVYAAAGPFLLDQWIRGDSSRYVWVIHQGPPCSSMGGGPGMLWVFATSWLAALAALGYALSGGLTRRLAAWGITIGCAVVLVTAAAMFPAPEIFAMVLGCR